MTRFLKREEAAALIRDGSTLLLTGSGGGLMDADFLYEAIERRFLETGHPRDLTLVHVTGIGDGKGGGVDRFAHVGMVKRVIGGHWGWSPKMQQLALRNQIEAYNLPQGVLSLLTREIAAQRKGLLTRIGLMTFVDPQLQGGKLNEAAQEDLVVRVELEGEELLLYRSFPVDVAIIRGTTADEDGNISVEWEAANLDVLSAAQAARNSGGLVIAQVKRVARSGTLNPRLVKVPAHLVDVVVVHPGQWQTCEEEYNPSFSGEIRIPLGMIEPLEFGVRKFVARRAAFELRPGAVVNLGFGIADGVANVAAEEGLIPSLTFTIEQGIVGGIPAKGAVFGAGYNPDAIIDAPSQFDFYHGGGIDIAFLGAAQVDELGNVNVSKFGNTIAGCGGFIDISQSAKHVVFCSTFTTGGLRVRSDGQRLIIEKEGEIKKFVRRVEHVTFSGPYARLRKQKVLYVTERAVFELAEDRLRLVEIAPGIDLETHILRQMEFVPEISPNLRRMDARVFAEDRMGIEGSR
ncbi:MAG: acyl CoA:acetate/3-ketoacid CoA transferase [candidate division KSB1 bacterium]|nr:acyl CoA:acetate/3-ketoacid CoA transferase [candidate division KSB1 bacterium]